MTTSFVLTADGSVTLYASAYDDHYHSTGGALTEAEHLFIQYGLEAAIEKNKTVNILEVGFGTGLNALCSVKRVSTLDVKLFYTAIEPYPVEMKYIELLNYPEILGNAGLNREWLMKMHLASHADEIMITENFRFVKYFQGIEEVQLPVDNYQLVFFDLFKPDSNPELWTGEIFRKLNQVCTEGAILVTYSSRGAVRRSLNEAGFLTEKLPGPGGKREITRAVKKIRNLTTKKTDNAENI